MSLRFRGRVVMSLLTLVGVCLGGVARGQVISEFYTYVNGPFGITAGPDGNVWFTEFNGNNIGRITPAGVVTEFPALTDNSSPYAIAAGPDGNLWFTIYTYNSQKIGRITTAGVVTLFQVPTAGSNPFGIAAGPDGNLWFTEFNGNNIGRITTGGVVTEFPIPAPASYPEMIAAGPDGNLWFTEEGGNNIARITTDGVITEFPIPTTGSGASGIAAGPDGNLWFTEFGGTNIGRITTAGVITEFPTPTADSGPTGIAPGPDGNLWFTEEGGNNIGRVTPAGSITEFALPTGGSFPQEIAAGPDGNLWFTQLNASQIGLITTGPVTPRPMATDVHAAAGDASNHNGVLEPGETVQVAASWKNTLTTPQAFVGSASNFTGPSGPSYILDKALADYGTVAAGAVSDCNGAPGGCYLMIVSGSRPIQHWDATFTETVSPATVPTLAVKTWKLHVGDSFTDVPISNPFYPFIENLFHNAVTGGCSGGNYCPINSVTRAQMAVFLMKSKLGAAEVPPPARGTVFADVPASNPFAPWIEQLAAFRISGGCGSGNFCPDNPVRRDQMAALLLKAEHGSSYLPPTCTGVFADVPCPSQFADWIEALAAESITGGCGGGHFCPSSPTTRGQMAVFLVKTFGLLLNGP